MATITRILPTADELERLFAAKYGDLSKTGWDPRTRHRFRYYTPDDIYEAVVARLITTETRWLDVGAGRNLFPNNRGLSSALATRCSLLVGVDPDDTIHENPYVHRALQGAIEDIQLDETFDLITLRMVVEHVAHPAAFFSSLQRHTNRGGKVVFYTVNKWSPAPIVARVMPSALQDTLTHWLWRTDAKDTFPVKYQMNTRAQLERLATTHGFKCVAFEYLDDCRTFSRFRALHLLELSLWSVLNRCGLRFPENCLLAVYERT